MTVQRYMPYGEPWLDTPSDNDMPTDHTFGGYLEIGGPIAASYDHPRFSLFYAGARFYSGAFGQFFSPDPSARSSATPLR